MSFTNDNPLNKGSNLTTEKAIRLVPPMCSSSHAQTTWFLIQFGVCFYIFFKSEPEIAKCEDTTRIRYKAEDSASPIIKHMEENENTTNEKHHSKTFYPPLYPHPWSYQSFHFYPTHYEIERQIEASQQHVKEMELLKAKKDKNDFIRHHAWE
jgi:hypothetical protein